MWPPVTQLADVGARRETAGRRTFIWTHRIVSILFTLLHICMEAASFVTQGDLVDDSGSSQKPFIAVDVKTGRRIKQLRRNSEKERENQSQEVHNKKNALKF